MRLLRFLSSLFLSLVCTPAAYGGDATAPGEMPFRYAHHLIWIDLHVEGAAQPLHFLLDTGAGATVIDLAAARRLGLKFGRSETVAGVDGRAAAWNVSGFHASAADAPVRDSLLAIDLGNVSRACGEHIDGLLGADFLRDKIVRIDYAAGRLRLFPRNDPMPVAAMGAVVLPLRQVGDAWCLPLAVSGNKTQWLRLDTGCDQALLWVMDRGVRLPDSGKTSVGVASGSRKFATLDIQLGTQTLPGITIGLHKNEIFPGESGLVGNPLLSRFKVTIDTSARKLLLERN